MFYTYGHYGSTVFDEMGREQLRINICDKCLLERKHMARVNVWHKRSDEEYSYKVWDPEFSVDEDDD